MQISEWLASSVNRLNAVNIPTTRLDCLVLLEEVTSKNRSWLLAHPEFELTADELHILTPMIKRRASHEPLAYIRGKAEFYGREFTVNEHTLQPRPETETMIELLLDLAKSQELKAKSNIADIGTGSGCIAITAKLEIPELEIVATDIDKECVDTATKNAEKLEANVKFMQGSLIEPLLALDFPVSAILCNLPYVPDKYELNKAARFEPKHAIFGGKDGLNVYRELFEQVIGQTQRPEYIFTESLPFQHQTLKSIALAASFYLHTTEDFIQVFKRST